MAVVRSAPRWLQSHLVPADNDAAAWLGLIQHYGGPTRLLDVMRSPYVALFLAFEEPGDHDRAVWGIDSAWCAVACARLMEANEHGDFTQMLGRITGAQMHLVHSLVHRQPYPDRLFSAFKPFRGVFPLDPWKPDARQSAQQALFLTVADPSVGFLDNLNAHPLPPGGETVLYKPEVPSSLRREVLTNLARMNVTAATLFPDLGGIARYGPCQCSPERQTRSVDLRDRT